MSEKDSSPIKIVIVEDEELYRLQLEAFVLELGCTLVGSTDNSEEAIKIIIDEQPEVVIMDININGKLNGIEVAEKLKHIKSSFLFITSLKEKEFYQKAKQTSYIGYLVKPFDEVTLQSAIELALSNNPNIDATQIYLEDSPPDFCINDSILVKHNNQLFKILTADITHIESKGKFSLVHTKERKLISNTTLAKLSKALSSKGFIRIHKSYVANVKHVQKVILKDNKIYVSGHTLPIGRVYKDGILGLFDIF